ncbi:hypothetical protein NP233_g5135 [Leucocoprinus birnbaumii]|uniref:Uncharacterized protein n=1 Tax=Leucocoprinus birnbaumii TaxID=56174 RepID=A0AAD5VTD2_9AGAR|nr:hypothetical protein NP233_g5135 [Leucocoprinus birnbaumii]
MTSAQHASQHSRYPLSSYSGDLRLPSLKDLNFYRPPPGNTQESVQSHNAAPNDFVASAPEHPSRHPQWSRSVQPAGMQNAMPAHPQHSQQQQQSQQHSPPLSAGHDMPEQSVQYNKHDGVYARPGIPLSAQVTPVPGSVNTGPAMRGEDTSPHSPVQARRPRPPSANMNAARDGRSSHNSYPAPYNTYPSNQPPPNSPLPSNP